MSQSQVENDKSEPSCCLCRVTASNDKDLLWGAADANMNPVEYARTEMGTYSAKTNLYACSSCYIKLGMPTQHHSADGKQWKADRIYQPGECPGTGPAGIPGSPLRAFQDQLMSDMRRNR